MHVVPILGHVKVESHPSMKSNMATL